MADASETEYDTDTVDCYGSSEPSDGATSPVASLQRPKTKSEALRALPKPLKASVSKAVKQTAQQPRTYPDQDALLVFENPDKVGAGNKSGSGRYMPAWPFRPLATGPPGSGKRNLALNVIFRLDPPPTSIHIVHIDPNSKEYKILEQIAPVTYYTPDAPPDFSALEEEDAEAAELAGDDSDTESVSSVPSTIRPARRATARPLVIIDETPTKLLGKEARQNLNTLVAYGSTHKNTSVILMFQNLTDIDPNIRRCFNHFAIWPSVDSSAMNLAAHRVGVPPDEMADLMSLCKDPKDFIWVDATRHPDDAYRFRLNLMYPIYRNRD